MPIKIMLKPQIWQMASVNHNGVNLTITFFKWHFVKAANHSCLEFRVTGSSRV